MRGHCAASRCGPLPIGVILRLACLARTGLPSGPWRSILRRQPVRQQIVGDPCDLVDIGGVVQPAVAHAEKDVHPRNRPGVDLARVGRSEEHTSELQLLMRTSNAVFCLKKKNSLLFRQLLLTMFFRYLKLNLKRYIFILLSLTLN